MTHFKMDKNSTRTMGGELLELVAAERCGGRQYQQGHQRLRKVYGQQVLKWIVEGVSR